MKKILGLIALTLVFACCDLGIKTSNAEETQVVDMGRGHGTGSVFVKESFTNGMQYNVYYSYSSIYVVNVTKDKLEVELLTLQIDSLKR